jgi:hypothetical protein
MATYEDFDEDYFIANYDAGADRMKEEQRSKVCPECDGTNLTENTVDHEKAEQLQRTFLIEGVEDHKVSVWTLEEVLREINRDSECTDEDGDVYIEGRYVMAGSPEDTVDHEKDDCYRPYDINDWEQGLYRLDYYRIIKEVPQKKEN